MKYASGPNGTTATSRNVLTSTISGAILKTRLSAFAGYDVFLLQPLADLGEQLHRAVRPGLHRAEAALHEAHHLEQEQVDDRAGGQQHGDGATEDAQQRLRPVRDRRPPASSIDVPEDEVEARPGS